MNVKIVNKSKFELPQYATSGSAGMDLRADLSNLNSKNWNEKLKYMGNVSVDFDTETTVLEGEEAVHPVIGLHLMSHSRVIIPTNLFIQLPEGYEAQIRPRSGLSFKTGVSIANSPGTIDSDFTGEIGIICSNLTPSPIYIKHGDRICQMVVSKFEQIEWESVKQISETERGEGGFGHTGV